MKERFIEVKSSALKTFVVCFVLLALMVFVLPKAAHAALQGSAANTIVINTVSVAYKDSVGNVQTPATATVSITVATVAVTPTVLSFTPSPGSTDGTGGTQVYTVTIRTNSNGPGAISFGTADGTFTNIAAGTIPTVPANIFIGATVVDPTDSHIGSAPTVANGANITFAIPNDGGIPLCTATSGGSIGDGCVNGLQAAQIVYVYTGTTYYGPFTIASVSDNPVGAGTTAAPDSLVLTNSSGSSITFGSNVAAGWQIVGAKTVTVTVTQGVITNPTLAASWVTTVSATMAGAAAGTGTVTTNAHIGQLTIVKAASIDGNTWANGPTSGLSIAPGGTIYYRITVTNTGTGNCTSTVLTDAQPTYTTYTAGSAKMQTGALVSYSAASTTLTDAVDGDGYDFGHTTANTVTYSMGTIAPGTANQVQLFYKVTIN